MNFTMYARFADMLAQHGIEKTAEYAVKMNFTSVEMFEDAVSKKYTISDLTTAGNVKKVLKENDLSMACYSVYANVWKNKETIKDLMRLVEIATELGAKYFHHTLLPGSRLQDRPTYEEGIREAVNAASQIADYASQMGLICIYEDQGQYVNGVKGFGGFWTEMKKRCGNIGICADLGNIMFVNESPETFLEAYVKDVCHVHVKDYLWKKASISPGRYWHRAKGDNWLRDTMVGSGVINFEACMKILKKAEYSGAFALELGHPEPYDDGVMQAMEYLQRI